MVLTGQVLTGQVLTGQVLTVSHFLLPELYSSHLSPKEIYVCPKNCGQSVQNQM